MFDFEPKIFKVYARESGEIDGREVIYEITKSFFPCEEEKFRTDSGTGGTLFCGHKRFYCQLVRCQ